jgi:hypothetical protein
MELNPYESPSPSSDAGGILGLLLRIIAVACWLSALLPVLAFFLIVNRPEMIDGWERNPSLFVQLCLAMFAFSQP